MKRSIWARITGKDKQKKFPNQQVSRLGRKENATIAHPYGLFTDLPNNVLLVDIGDNTYMPIVVDRPFDSELGEPVFFHPATGTRIIAKNDKSLDIISDSVVNIKSPLTNLGEGGEKIARLGDEVLVEVTGGSSAGFYTGTITSSGVNTST